MRYDISACQQQLVFLGKSQADVARDLGMSRSLVSKFFLGQSVLAKTAKLIIEDLELKVEDVFIPEKRRKSA